MKNNLVRCPVCYSDKAKELLKLNCGNLDGSTLYQFVKINACDKCGHIYNNLSPSEIAGLIKYYNEEYAPTNIGSPDKIGDRPGSNNKNTLERYDQLYNLILQYINSDYRILDVGCAMGGFLNYLRLKGFHNLSGIDPIIKYVENAKKENDYDVRVGTAESMPFADKSFDLLVMDQVTEHLIEPIKVFKEAKRVLVDGGLLCLGMPDAMKYDKNYFFDFYWFIMREHVQHFDIEHLKLIAERGGFELIGSNESETPMMSEKMILPNLNAIFRLTGGNGKLNITKDCFKLKKKIKQYIINDFKKLNRKKKKINDLIVSQKSLYVWGIGREFLYLYESAGLKFCNIANLIDMNKFKQKSCSINKIKIKDPDLLEKAPPDSVLLITAIAHINSIKQIVGKSSFKGKIFNFD